MEEEVLDAGEGLTRGIGYSFVLTYTGDNSCTYEWWLEDFSHSQAPYLETEDFIAGQYKWRLRLFPNAVHREINYIAVNLVSLNPEDVTANVVVEAFDQRNSQNNRVSDGRFTFTLNQDLGFPRFQNVRSVFEPNSGFLYLGRYVIKAFIEVTPTEADQEAPLQRVPVPTRATGTIHVSILTNELFEQKLDQMHPFGLLDLPDGANWVVQASVQVSTFTAQVCREYRYNQESMRLWICSSTSDGSARVRRPLRSQRSPVDETMGDLCRMSDSAVTGQLTLYLEVAKDGSGLPELYDDSWILFCKFVHPSEDNLTYLGSITIRRVCMAVDLKEKARELAQWPGSVEFDVFVQRDHLRPTKIDSYIELEDCGLHNGDVFLLCQTPSHSTIDVEQLHVRLQYLFCQRFESLTHSAEDSSRQSRGAVHNGQGTSERLGGPQVRSVESAIAARSSDQRLPQDNEDLCVICYEGRKTSGFLHADSEVHLCVCRQCADIIMQAEHPRCPLCNQAVTQLIKRLR